MDSPVLQNYGLWILAATFFIVGLGTYFFRFAFYWFFRNRDFSENIKRVLRFLPAAVFSALVFPQIFSSDAQDQSLLQNEKFLASLVAAIVGFITKSVFLTILIGMTVYWILIKFA